MSILKWIPAVAGMALVFILPVWADPIVVRPADFDQVIALISSRVDARRVATLAPKVDASDEAVVFMSRQPLLVKKAVPDGQERTERDDYFFVKTTFFVKTSTIEKKVWVSQGTDRDDEVRLRFTLSNDRKAFEQFLYSGLGIPMQIYNRGDDMFIYCQSLSDKGAVDMKEWIYARKPNSPYGSRYHWKVVSEEFYRKLILEPDPSGVVDIKRQVIVQGIDAHDYVKQRHAIDVIKKVGKGQFSISGEDTIGQVQRVFYVTREGKKKAAQLRISNRNELEIQINEPAQSYPLLIES